jgi:hypothetical protein
VATSPSQRAFCPFGNSAGNTGKLRPSSVHSRRPWSTTRSVSCTSCDFSVGFTVSTKRTRAEARAASLPTRSRPRSMKTASPDSFFTVSSTSSASPSPTLVTSTTRSNRSPRCTSPSPDPAASMTRALYANRGSG